MKRLASKLFTVGSLGMTAHLYLYINGVIDGNGINI